MTMTNTENPKSERMTKSKASRAEWTHFGVLGLSLFGLILGLWVFRHSDIPEAGRFTKANGGFIWLIVGIFWVVAQLAGAAAKKQPPRPAETDDESGDTPVDPFAELMRKMAGARTVEVPKPEYDNEPEYEEEQEADLAATERMPDIEPLRREVRGQTDPPPAMDELPEIAIRPKMSAFRNRVPAIKLPAMNMSFQGLETSVKNVPNLGNILNPADKASLRRAMLSHIIFSKPKALEQSMPSNN